jgi:hypothetical protein
MSPVVFKANGVDGLKAGWLDTTRTRRPDLERLAATSLVAALSVAIVRAAEPFDHGIWLVAYLFLVGFLAQLLLARGQAALLARSRQPRPPASMRRVQLVLWNLGVLIVPFGVLGGSRLAVLFGSVALLWALHSFWDTVREVLADASTEARLRGAYLALLGFMAASAVVGLALAWDIPWL